MTTFREGDVVRCGAEGVDARVTIPGAEVTTVEGSMHAYWFTEKLTLLRRPVRVGDVLKTPSGHTFAATDRDVRVGDHDLCVHADGTPIDPPRRKPQGLTAGCEACNHSWPRCVCPEARPPARIIGHTPDGRVVIAGGLEPTEEERAAYFAGVREREAATKAAIEAVSDSRIDLHPDTKAALAEARERDVWRPTPVAQMPIAFEREIRRMLPPVWPYERMIAALATREGVGAPTVEQLARALFESDDDVSKFVHTRTETCGWDGRGSYEDFKAAREARYIATMQTAWTRGHAGESPEWKWYVRAVDRAERMHAALGGGK